MLTVTGRVTINSSPALRDELLATLQKEAMAQGFRRRPFGNNGPEFAVNERHSGRLLIREIGGGPRALDICLDSSRDNRYRSSCDAVQ